jgi:calcineurin-like phosphoesterase family protein
MNTTPTFFFTADEHYGHTNIIKFCDRPFASIEEMDAEIIKRHNELVGSQDVVIHAGDFTLTKKPFAENYIRRLNGTHIFHFAMRVWPRSHFNSWQLYGHSHGKLPPIGKQWDIGVDNSDFYPVSFNKICEIMADRPDNSNFVKNIAA